MYRSFNDSTVYSVKFSTQICCLLYFNSLMAIENPSHELIKDYLDFEIRKYDSTIVATTAVKDNYNQATSTGFRRIAKYIFGGNSEGMSIAMTAPVITSAPNEKGIYEISFFMPSEYSMHQLPNPDLENIILKTIKLGTVAVLKFGGWATEIRASKFKKKLGELIENNGYKIEGEYLVAQYNSPWAIPPFRKNEILVKIK